MASSTERHNNEIAAMAARLQGTNREYIRQAKVVQNTFVDGAAAIMSGECRISEAYNLAKGETRVGLFVKIAPQTRATLRREAKERGVSMSELVEFAVTQIFG